MTTLAMAAPGTPTVDTAKRTITGLAVPYGPVGVTSSGRLQFAAGALSWSEARRVKLLREHDQRDVVGFAAELSESPEGLVATFHVPEGENGDRALAEAAAGLRDAFSVGVQLDDKTAERLRRANGGAVQGAGQLREVSLVSVPAFDDARVAAVAHADLTVSSWTDQPTSTEGTHPVTETAAATVAETPAAAAAAETPPPAPAPLAVAGAAYTTAEPSTYSFSADGPSLVLDAYNARLSGDMQAAERLARYNAELTDGNPASVMALAAVMRTTDEPELVAPNQRRPDLMLRNVNIGRPITSRIPIVPIRNATPFLLPTEGEFSGVALHTEGTAHVPEGTMTFGETTVTPRAISGAFRVSREMVDSSNPAIDRLALAAMLRDYQRQTEARVVAAFAAADTTSTLSVDTVDELRRELLAFGDDTVTADAVLAGRGFLTTILRDKDTTGRPMLPYVGPSNASGTTRAGYTGFSVDGVEVVRATSLPTNEAYIVDADSVMIAESGAQTFRFDEVEGPGIVKLALFGYFAVGVLRANAVHRMTAAAA